MLVYQRVHASNVDLQYMFNESHALSTGYVHALHSIPFHFIKPSAKLPQFANHLSMIVYTGSFESLRSGKSPLSMGKSGYIMVNHGISDIIWLVVSTPEKY